MSRYEYAKERYAKIGVDTEKATALRISPQTVSDQE